MEEGPAAPGPEFWASPAVCRALTCCDFGVLLEQIRTARGWSQAELAATLGYSQSWVSKVIRGRQPLTLEQARDIAVRAGIPVHLLRLGDQAEEDTAKRRDFGKVAAALSEAAGLAGWLHTDMCDRGSARSYYRVAVKATRQARHDLLAGYMLGSLAVFEVDNGDPVAGLGLIGRAREQIGAATHPTPQAWLAAIQALCHATAGDGYAADAALDRAARVVGDADAVSAPPWPWLFSFDHGKLAGYRALACVRLGRPAAALTAFAQSLGAVQPAPEQRAVIMLEVATAACQDGTTNHDTTRLDEAFGLASDALAAGERYGSERVIERSRQFRRGYRGPVTGPVRQFDRQVQALLS